MRGDKFLKLLQIQNLELEITRVNNSIKKLQAQEEDLIARIEKLKEERERLVKRIEELKQEIEKHKVAIEECRKRLRRAEETLKLVKKAEEYKALLRERARNEDCIIKLKNSLSALEEEIRALEEKREDKRRIKQIEELTEELSDVRYSQSRLQDKLEGLKSNLEKIKEETEREIWLEYENLKRKYGLPIILPVDSMGSCAHCGTKLPSALYSRVIQGEVVVCPSCGRFVYYERET